jgi:glycosyltransferase involved in cell wall biosynthesis
MKLLHLFSNYKLTGPAEPAVRLASHLMRRGHEVLFAHQPTPRPMNGMIDEVAQSHGLTTCTDLHLYKHFKPRAILHDRAKLAKLIDEHRFDIIHCNLINDHLIAALAVRRAKHKPRIVRTNHDARPMRRDLRSRLLVPKRTDALIELSEQARTEDIRRFGLRPEAVHRIDTAVDLERFTPDRELPDLRARWGLTPDHFVVGVIARIQKRRQYPTLLRAAALVREQLPNFRLAVIGRGTHMNQVAVQPARRLGLDSVVFFPGYLRGEDYVAGLRALDAKVFMVPGTDGSCRAAREAMASGRAVIATRRGMLPELISDGEDGLLADERPEALAEAILELGRDRERCRAMGDAARRTALRRFAPEAQAEAVEAVYRRLLPE